MAKRLFDLTVAALALALLWPLLLVLALVIRIDSPGPAWFRQQRVGRHGTLFRIHKLRTMVSDAAAQGPQITLPGDARVTRAGRVLRRYHLDELPQLIDVLAGHMSLVGPRPEVPRYVALYPALLREVLLSVRPGITDPAALEFADEAEQLAAADDAEQAYVHDILPRKLQRQADYIRRSTLASDVAVIVQTLRLRWTRG